MNKQIKPYDELHQQGLITVETPLSQGSIVGDLGVQIARDGRIWLCINGIAVIRFKPNVSFKIGE